MLPKAATTETLLASNGLSLIVRVSPGVHVSELWVMATAAAAAAI